MDLSFLTIPVTVREQIYAELLTCPPPATTERARAPSSPICKLLTLNRQIHDEIGIFMRSRLFVLIKTNDTQFLHDIIKDKEYRLPLISQLRSEDNTVRKDASKAPIAMEIDFYMFSSDLALAGSSAGFLIPATSIKALLSILWLPIWSIWCMQASITFTLIDTFAHVHEKAEELLVEPWIRWFVPSHFVGICTSPPISVDRNAKLKARLLGKYEAKVGHLRKLQSLQHAAGESAEVSKWSDVAKRFAMASRYARVIWECHDDCMRQNSSDGFAKDAVLHLWLMTNDTAAHHVISLLNAARNEVTGPVIAVASGDAELTMEARQVAEDTIAFLSEKSPYGCEGTAGDERAQTMVRKSKAKMDYRTHMACKGLGDLDAAIGYLEEAMRYEPETSEKLLANIEELKVEGASGRKEDQTGVVRWEDEGAETAAVQSVEHPPTS